MKHSKVWFEGRTNIISRVVGLLLATERDFGSSLSVLSALPAADLLLDAAPDARCRFPKRCKNRECCPMSLLIVR